MNKHHLLEQQAECSLAHIQKIKFEQAQGVYPKAFSLPLGLQLELTSKCSLYCKHCYNASGENHSKDKMTVLDWKKVVNDIIREGGIFQCIISGGEPLMMGAALYEIMDLLHDDGTGFVLITNGMLVCESTVKKLKKYNFYWVQVSIDDVLSEAHDEFRGKQGSWEKAVNAAYLFSGAGLPLRVAHSVTPENLSRLVDMIDLAYKLGASSIVCGNVMSSGRAVVNSETCSNDESFLNEMYSVIEDCQNRYRGKMDILSSSDLAMDINRKRELPNSAIVVRPNGDVRVDCTMPFIIGNVLENNIADIWRNLGADCWSHPRIEKYISELNEFGIHPFHKNHNDFDIKLESLK